VIAEFVIEFELEVHKINKLKTKIMKNIQIIDNLYKAFGTGDIPTVLGSMHSEIE